MYTILGFKTFRWARMALFASAATACVCGTAVAQSATDAPLPDPAELPQEAESSLDLAPGEMLLNPEMIPPELRPKFPENAPSDSVMEGEGHPHHGGPGYGADLGGFSTSCGGCDPGYVGRFDALYMTNDSADGVSLSNQFRLDEFDYELGGRALLRRQFDCVNGYEVVATIVPEWEEFAQTDATVSAVLVAPGGEDIGTFQDSTRTGQAYRAEYSSFEANRTYNGWDVARTLIGIRVIDYEEDYGYAAEKAGTDALYQQNTENLLVGLQAGLDLYYPLSERLWTSVRGRGGLFANFADGRTFVTNDTNDAAATIARNKSDDEDYAGLIEIGAGLRYDLGPALSIHGGYELWYLHNVATASDQLSATVSPTLGRRLIIDDDVMMHGLNLGAQLRY